MLHDASSCKMPYFYVPIRIAYLLAAQMEKKARKTGEKSLMTNFAVYNLARNNELDYSKAERELGYHTRSYAETLGKLMKAGGIYGFGREELGMFSGSGDADRDCRGLFFTLVQPFCCILYSSKGLFDSI